MFDLQIQPQRHQSTETTTSASKPLSGGGIYVSDDAMIISDVRVDRGGEMEV